MKTITEYINESNNKIPGFEDYTTSELLSTIEDYIDGIICDVDASVDRYEIWLHGSRLRGDNKKNSDLDVVMFYWGKNREDDLFNCLHDEEDKLTLNGIDIDINPVKVTSEKDIEDYKHNSHEYDLTKLR